MDTFDNLMLGTSLKLLFEEFGITPEWYKMMKGKVGLLPECDCEFREELLNATYEGYKKGGWKQAAIEYDKVVKYYSRPR